MKIKDLPFGIPKDKLIMVIHGKRVKEGKEAGICEFQVTKLSIQKNQEKVQKRRRRVGHAS